MLALVVQERERNTFEMRVIQDEMWNVHGIVAQKYSFAELRAEATLD